MEALETRVRAATIADLDQILAFIHQKAAFDGFKGSIAATRETLQRDLFGDRPLAEVAFAEVAGTAIGFALFFQTYSSFLAKPSIWIDDLFVQAPYRRQGVGTALVSYVAQVAESRNCGRMEWAVDTNNPGGMTFYRQMGAQILEGIRLCRMAAPAIAALTQKEHSQLVKTPQL